MSETNAAAAPAGSTQQWLRILLIAAAFLELLSGASDLPILFGDTSEVPGPGLGGLIIAAKIAVQPILALVALIAAIRGNLRIALFAMAGLIFMMWLSYMPSIAIHGLEFSGDGFWGLAMLFQIVLAPLIAAAVVVLAARNEKMTLATVLAVLPTAFGLLGVIIFAIGVGIYGF